MKGISFNVTLSEEQIEEIAARSADKVLMTKNYIRNNEIWLQNEIDQLRSRINQRDKLLVKKELQLDRALEKLELYRKKIEELEEVN